MENFNQTLDQFIAAYCNGNWTLSNSNKTTNENESHQNQ